MQLVRLELSGFKSFSKKTVLTFNHPITGIVGPNGSGKSNVAEAIRFVLGEQSMKSLRGKQGTDLIFKGSDSLSPLGRASVIAFFDNRKNRNTHLTDGVFTYLQFDEIRIAREIYADSTNEYSINDTKVRLKDIQELLATANIGTTGHHMISQGEADRVLTATVRERKEMIEEALGLKLYQWRIKEAERKLEKTDGHLREAEIVRREIAPQLSFLKKQVLKIELRKEYVAELTSLYYVYLKREEGSIKLQKNKQLQSPSLAQLESEHQAVVQRLVTLQTTLTNALENDAYVQSKQELQKTFQESIQSRNLAYATVLRFEAEEKVLTRNLDKTKAYEASMGNLKATVSIEKTKAENARKDLTDYIGQAKWRMERHEISEVPSLLNVLKHTTTTFFDELCQEVEQNNFIAYDSEQLVNELKLVRENLLQARSAYEVAKATASEHETTITDLENNIEQRRDEYHASEKELYENRIKKTELEGLLEKLKLENTILAQKVSRFQEEIQEGTAIVGSSLMEYVSYEEQSTDNRSQDELYRKIERLKIKLEEAQISNASDLLDEYDEVMARDDFIAREITDLQKTERDLRELISELSSKLDNEFVLGITKINTQFTMFFTDMFGGGSAGLFEVQKQKRLKRKNDDTSVLTIETEDESSNQELEVGIDVKVTLPGKKVKDISMLSGGERALTSIALLFAIAGVNPPPFMVLDETDAALDEANARRYGKSLKHLAKHSKLVVITHNRETMNQADSLYGVTVAKDGASKVLSVEFGEASEYAK